MTPFLKVINLNLVLPKTQRRFQLFIEGQGDDNDESQDDQKTANVINQDASDEEGLLQKELRNATTAGLRYIVDTAGIKTSSDVGVSVNIPSSNFCKIK